MWCPRCTHIGFHIWFDVMLRATVRRVIVVVISWIRTDGCLDETLSAAAAAAAASRGVVLLPPLTHHLYS